VRQHGGVPEVCLVGDKRLSAADVEKTINLFDLIRAVYANLSGRHNGDARPGQEVPV
jgi:hypothetical protein